MPHALLDLHHHAREAVSLAVIRVWYLAIAEEQSDGHDSTDRSTRLELRKVVAIHGEN